MHKFLAALSVGIVLTSCADQKVRVAPLSPSELNKQADAFDGKTVTVRGFLAFDNEARYMVDDRETLENWSGDPDKCITITNLDRLWDSRKMLDQNVVELSGVYKKDVAAGTVMLGACNISGIELDPKIFPRVVK